MFAIHAILAIAIQSPGRVNSIYFRLQRSTPSRIVVSVQLTLNLPCVTIVVLPTFRRIDTLKIIS